MPDPSATNSVIEKFRDILAKYGRPLDPLAVQLLADADAECIRLRQDRDYWKLRAHGKSHLQAEVEVYAHPPHWYGTTPRTP